MCFFMGFIWILKWILREIKDSFAHHYSLLPIAKRVNFKLSGFLLMNCWITKQAIMTSPSGVHSPWFTGIFFVPSISNKNPSFSIKAIKWVYTRSSTLVYPFFTDFLCLSFKPLFCWKIVPRSSGFFSSVSIKKFERKLSYSNKSGYLWI